MTPVLEIGLRKLWPIVVILAGGGVGILVVGLFVTPGVSLFTLVAMLFWGAALVVAVDSARPRPVIRAGAAGVAFGDGPAAPWSTVDTLVVLRAEEMSYDGPVATEFVAFAAVTDSPVDPAEPFRSDDLDTDPRVVAWSRLPGALLPVDAGELGARLRPFRPDLAVLDIRPAA